MMVYGWLSSRTVRPMIKGSAPNRVVHSTLLRMTTRCLPSWSSSGAKLRHTTGWTPKMPKKGAEPRPPRRCPGSPPPQRDAAASLSRHEVEDLVVLLPVEEIQRRDTVTVATRWFLHHADDAFRFV